jgi:hypothetical protein
MTVFESYHRQIAIQAASLSILPGWYPFFAKSIYQRSQILESKSPGDLSHSNFFKNKCNYYRGFTANLSMQPLYPLTEWMLGVLLNKIKQVNQRDPNIVERVGAGFITGAATVALANPYDVIVIASQKYGQTPYSAFKKVLKCSGARGLYTGALPMAVRNGTFVSSLLVATPVLQKKIDQHISGTGKVHDVAIMILASTIPASMYICVAIPLDFMAIMRQSDPLGKIHTSAFQAIKAAYHKHGRAAFKAGLGNRLLACTIEMAGFNLFKNFYLEKLQA